MDRKVFSKLLSGTRRQYVATGGTLLSTWCSETVKLIARWIYFECTDRPTTLFGSLSINNLLVFAIEISQAISDSLFHGKPVQPNMSTQNAPLAGQSSFAFFQHDQFESFLISFPAFTFYAKLWPKENLRVYFRVLQGVILFTSWTHNARQ